MISIAQKPKLQLRSQVHPHFYLLFYVYKWILTKQFQSKVKVFIKFSTYTIYKPSVSSFFIIILCIQMNS